MTLIKPTVSGRGVEVDGAQIRAIRTQRSYSVSALAQAAGCSRAHLANVEAKRRKPSPDLLRALATVLRVDVTELYPAAAR